MMAELGYAGQIGLSQGRREIDFSSYGIKIQVQLQPLWSEDLSLPSFFRSGSALAKNCRSCLGVFSLAERSLSPQLST